MKDDLNEDKQISKKTKGRKRGKRIEDSESEQSDEMKKNSLKKRKYSNDEIESEKETEKYPQEEKQTELQKKLKFIFNEVREKGKYEYNKQEIPENLKYHSDESDSSIPMTINSKIKKDKNGNKNIYNTNSNKISENQSSKIRNSKKSKDNRKFSSISSKKNSINDDNNKENNNNIITEFNLENNSKEISDNKKSVNNKSDEKSNIEEEENNSENKNDKKKIGKEEKNKKLKNLLENKKDILQREKEKQEKQEKQEKDSYLLKKYPNSSKSKEENIYDQNNSNIKETEEKEKEENISPIHPKEKSLNNVREILDKLRAKQNEKEDLARLEKEAEEQSLMRVSIKKETKETEEKINEQDIEKEMEKIRKKEKRMEERRLAREKRRKMEEEEKKRKEKEFEEKKKKEKLKKEEILNNKNKKDNNKNIEDNENEVNDNIDLNIYPRKTYKEEGDNQQEKITYKKSSYNSNKISGGKYENKYCFGKKYIKEDESKNKKVEKDLKDEFNKNEILEIKNESKNIKINNISPKTKIEKKNESINAYKKPVQKNFGNGKNKIYCPKKPGGAIRGRSHEKAEQNLINKISKNKNILNDNSGINFTSIKNKKPNGNNFINSPSVTYSKKRSIGGLASDNFVQLNKSFGEYRNNTGFENGNNNNLMNGMYNINTLELSSLPDLNSSFDSRVFNYNNNSANFQILNNEFYTRTAQKNYHNNTINSGNLNSSNRYSNINNLLGNNNLGNFQNLNGLNYINGENDNLIHLNNNSIFGLQQNRINPYDLNSSYNIGYNNPLTNYQNSQVNLSELLSNNYIGLNNNISNMQRNLINYNLNTNNLQKLMQKKNSSINIEDLLVLDEKFSDINIALNKTKVMNNECFEFWNYYFNCSLYGSLEKLFTNILDSNNVQISINFILMSTLICYDCSYEEELLSTVFSILKDLLNLNHKNLLLIYEHILSKISTESRENIWVLKLLNIVNSSKNTDLNDYNTLNGYSMTLVEKINFNTGIIIQNIRVLLKNYKLPRVEYLTSLFKKINDKSYEDINNFFRQYILRVENMNGSILASVLLKDNSEFKSVPPPYLHTFNQKPYSLILELEETLVYFKVNPENESEGVLKVRPGVMEFLEEVDKYYELIVFTCSTQDYANLLIEAIEESKIYFEHRLYRQHTIIIDNDFVKDLTRIGRPLDKIVIVDNMPQNFRLQKENGINIKPFWGEDIYDAALINLAPILINIAEEGGDIRQSLAKYRDEIVEKVTSNIYKHNV